MLVGNDAVTARGYEVAQKITGGKQPYRYQQFHVAMMQAVGNHRVREVLLRISDKMSVMDKEATDITTDLFQRCFEKNELDRMLHL